MKHNRGHSSPSVDSPERRITVAGLAGLGAFQLALAVGAPWGRASYGGAHPGVLPARLRVVSAVAALVYPATAYAIGSARTPARARRRVLTAVSGAMALGTVANGMSRSAPERAIWTPTAALLAAAAWRARDEVGHGARRRSTGRRDGRVDRAGAPRLRRDASPVAATGKPWRAT